MDSMTRRGAFVFFAFAVLAGPVRGFTSSGFYGAVHFQQLAGGALSGIVAGVALLMLGFVLRQKRLCGRQWLALLVLLLPQWAMVPLTAPYVRAIPALHETRWGLAFMLTLAAPLWLALLSALEWVEIQVPRAVVGAAIAGIGAAYLIIPVDAYSVSFNQAPVLLVEVFLNIAIVFTWVYAAPRLAGAGMLIVAGCFLLMSAVGNVGLALVFERGAWQPLDWREVWTPLLMEATVVACSCWLWLWLLQRMPLAAFGMRALAAFTASLLPGFVFGGFAEWRIDAAVVIALAAIVVALRARVAEEQPIALGLRDS